MPRFEAVERIAISEPPWPGGWKRDQDVLAFVSKLWYSSFRSMMPEHDRMTRMERYYSGFHYKSAAENRDKEITNEPFSMIETIWPELVQGRPRPKIVAGAGVPLQIEADLQDFAEWIMNTDGFDACFRMGTRERSKLGWNADLIVFDPRTGMPYPKNWCNWDLYPDFTARHEDSWMFYFLAGPVPTALLQAMFPAKRSLLKPDGWVSPSYDALVRPYEEAANVSGFGDSMRQVPHLDRETGFAFPVHESVIPGTSGFLPSSQGTAAQGSGLTTFLIQLFFRDPSSMPVTYRGKRFAEDGENYNWDFVTVPEPCCQSGWRVIQCTTNCLLDMAPLDPAYFGHPITIGRRYEQAFRMFAPGDLDPIVSKVMGLNRRIDALNEALDYQRAPILIADTNAGTDFDREIEPGTVMRKRQGTQVDRIDFRGPSESQFLMVANTLNSIDRVGGVHDPTRGRRPTGIESGAAIEALKSAADSRIMGNEGGVFAQYSLLLKKLMVGAGKKLKAPIRVRVPSGRILDLDPEILMNEYQVRFEEGSGLESSRQRKKDEMLALYEKGLALPQEVRDVFGLRTPLPPPPAETPPPGGAGNAKQ